jgi:hypothetical protein
MGTNLKQEGAIRNEASIASLFECSVHVDRLACMLYQVLGIELATFQDDGPV